MKILVVVAHPDDETFGMGCTLRGLSESNEVRVVTVCKGDDVRLSTQKKILNSINIISMNLGYDDTFLDTISQTELNIKLSHIVDTFRPDVVYTHSQDLHSDHTIVSKCMDVVCRPQSEVRVLYHFATPGNVDWRSNFKANTFMGTSEMWSTKETFINLYDLYEQPHPCSVDKIKARDIQQGSIAGLDMAESFELVFSR